MAAEYIISKSYLDREVINALTGGTLVPLNSTQLNGKPSGYYLDSGTTQTITGSKTFSNVNNLKFTAYNTATTTPDLSSVVTHPFVTDTLHDHFAFLRSHSITDEEVSTDGSAWAASTLDIKGLFIQKESNGVLLLNSSQMGFRFCVYSNGMYHASMIGWFEFGVNYAATFKKVNITIECTSDKSNWTTLATGVLSASTATFYLKSAGLPSNQKYIRFTFMKQESGGTLELNCIRALTSRKGNQGLGKENAYPYQWNVSNELYPITNNAWSLGNSSYKWANVYATTFTGNLSGKASSADVATNSTKVNGYNVQVVTSMPSSPDANTIYILKS